MLLSQILDLKQRLHTNREKMYVLARDRGLNDPEVILASQELDKVIVTLQKLLIYESPDHTS